MTPTNLSQELPASTDIAVIGGGIMGASIAWHLARLGAGSVTLFEQHSVGAGASGRTGALLRQHYTNVPEATLAHASLHVFRNWTEIVGGTCGFDETGLIVTIPAGPDADVNSSRLRANVAMQRSLGIETRAISPSELRDIDPLASADGVAIAAYEAATGCVDAVAATLGMAIAARSAGVRIVEHTGVSSISVASDRVTGITNDRGRIRCGAAIIATGPWSPRLVRSLGIDLPIDSVRVQVVTFLRPLTLSAPHAAYVDIAAGMFCRPFGPGRTMVGVSGGDQHDPVDPDAFNPTLDPTYPGQARAALARRFPAMRDGVFLTGHAGLYDMTPDAHPMIGRLPVDGLYVAAGFSGAGFKKGPAVGQAMADLIMNGSSALVDLEPFRPERFSEPGWDVPWSETEYVLSADFGHKF